MDHVFTRSSLIRIATVAVATMAFHCGASAQQASHRLILKDGSYQSVAKYEVKGDRVRYLSAERDEWEELPSSLVDWPATDNYEKERATAPAPEAAELDKEFNAEHEAADARLPEVAPGLHLPELAGMYLLDNFKGQPQLVELQQSESDLNRNTKTNILRGALNPAAGAKGTVELEGEHASVYAHVGVPSIYIKMDEEAPPPGETDSAKPTQLSMDAPREQAQRPEQAQQPEKAVVPFDRFRIVRLQVKKGKRIVGDVKRTASGKTSQDQNSLKATIDRVAHGWLKLTPTADLAPGEYAIVETRGGDSINLYVWPFAVNPNAPANANPWTPKVKGEKTDQFPKPTPTQPPN